MDIETLLQGVQAKREALLNTPNAEREFTRSQFQELKNAIEAGNQAIAKALKAIPSEVSVKNFPDAPEQIDNTDKLIEAIKGIEFPEDDDSALIDAIKKIDVKPNVKVEAPKLNIPAPVVKVDAPDFKPVIKAIEEAKPEPTVIDLTGLEKLLKDSITASNGVKAAIKSLKFPVANTPTDPLIYYLPSDIDDAAGATGINYLGYTDNKGAWYVKKIDNSASPKTIRFSFGQSNYTTNWTNRAALSYSIWGS